MEERRQKRRGKQTREMEGRNAEEEVGEENKGGGEETKGCE